MTLILKLHFPYRDAQSVPLVFVNFPFSSVRLGLLFRPQLVAVVLLMIHTNPVVILASFP